VAGEEAVVDRELRVRTGVGDRQRAVDERLPAHPLRQPLQAAAEDLAARDDLQALGVADVLVRGLKAHPLLRVDAVHLFELRHLDQRFAPLGDGHLDERGHRVRGLELAHAEAVGAAHVHAGHAGVEVDQRSDLVPEVGSLLQCRVHLLVDDGSEDCLIVDVESGHLVSHPLPRGTRRWTGRP
jgi:hypothetical protein